MLLRDWLSRDLPPIRHIIRPWMTEGSISMIYGPRGVSKTNVTMALALAIAQGEPFLGFQVPEPRRVLYIDGEMQRGLVRDRLRKFHAHTARPRALHNLDYINYADEERGIGDLARDGDGRERIAEALSNHEAGILILDNKSSLIRAGDENSAEAYQDFNDWLLGLRAAGVTTLLIHHAGKRNAEGRIVQRGTSRVEDVMDCIIQLDKAADVTDGCVPVRWRFEKHRSFTPREADLVFDLNVRYDDVQGLAWLELAEPNEDDRPNLPDWIDAARRLKDQGFSLRDIGQQLGIGHVTVKRWLDRAMEPSQPSERG